jgi:predicted restriction endonuclease
MHESFSNYLSKVLSDNNLRSKTIELVEGPLSDFIRTFFYPDFGSIYQETTPSLYDEIRKRVFTHPEASLENQILGGAYTQALKYYADFLRSKYFSTAKLVSKDIKPKDSFKTTVEKQPLVEGAKVQVRLEKHERNPELRKACIAHYGYVCQVCGLDFTKAYGDLGKEFIEVHHLTPISTIDGEHEVDPIEDLVPLCSNCHSMIHRGENRPLTLEELRAQYIGYKWNETAD